MLRLLGPAILLLLLGLLGLLWSQLNQPITLVQVSGDLNDYEREAIRGAVSASLDQGLLRLRLDSVKDNVQGLSWLRDVTVRRLWPAGLAIHVDRGQPVARWGAGGYLSTQGSVIPGPESDAGPDTLEAGLPLLHCQRATPREAMEVYRLLSDALVAADLKIAELRETALGEWSARLAGGPLVILGRERLVERMERFVLVYARVLRDRLDAVGQADARYPNGVAVRWDPPLIAYGEHRNDGDRR